MEQTQPRLASEARALPTEERKRILAEIRETDFHDYLASLFRAMNSEYLVEVTHGVRELGKDLVVFRDDPLSPDVIAIVVKRGDIRAKTAGDVDEIHDDVNSILTGKGDRITAELRSQVRQSKAHTAEMKSIFARLEVTKVIVVLVGDISTSVRTRFEAEVGATASVRDINWLIKEFTERYPQVFFDARATDFLGDLVAAHEHDSFYEKTGRTLSECFVEPIIQPDRRLAIDNTSLEVSVKAKRVPFGELPKLIQRKKRVLLVGEAGSGKSKAAAMLCINRYRQILASSKRSVEDNSRDALPFLVSARQLAAFEDSADLEASLLPLEVHDRFSVGMLIVDGLDEVLTDDRQQVFEKATRFASNLNASLLVTARNIAAFSTAPPSFYRCELLPFQVSQALKLVERVLTTVDVLPALKEGIQRIRSQLPMSPLSLLLLIEVVAERKEVPSSITELYDRFLDLVFGRWDREKGVDVLFEYVVKKRFLASLAYNEFYSKGRLEVPASEFQDFTQRYAEEYGWDARKLEAFSKEIERAGVLTVQQEIFFRHRSFLDYFVAFHIHDRRDTADDLLSQLVNIYFDQLWSDVTFFFAGLAREVPEELIERILQFQGSEHNLEKLMVGRILQAGWHSPRRVKERGIRGAIDNAPLAARAGMAAAPKLQKRQQMSAQLFGDLLVVLLAEQSLGSVFLSQELEQYVASIESNEIKDRESALRRLSALWAIRRTAGETVVRGRLETFLGDLQRAPLSATDEAEMLLLTMAAQQDSEELRKSVMRKLKKMVKSEPSILPSLFPGANAPYRVPRAN